MGKQPQKKKKDIIGSFPSLLLNMALGMKACSQKEDISERLSPNSHTEILLQEKSEFSNLLPLGGRKKKEEKKRHELSRIL